MSLNRWIFKWHLKVRMFSHSRMSAGKEFQVDRAATEKAGRASSVCMRGTTSIGASEERNQRWCTGLYQLAEIRWSGCGPHLVSQYSQFTGDPLPHRKPV